MVERTLLRGWEAGFQYAVFLQINYLNTNKLFPLVHWQNSNFVEKKKKKFSIQTWQQLNTNNTSYYFFSHLNFLHSNNHVWWQGIGSFHYVSSMGHYWDLGKLEDYIRSCSHTFGSFFCFQPSFGQTIVSTHVKVWFFFRKNSSSLLI